MTTSPLPPAALPVAWPQPELLIPFGLLLVALGGLILTAYRLLKSDIKDSETRLREEMKASEARQREEMRASEVRQREAISEVKGEIKLLGEKLDRMVESVRAARSS